MVETRFGLMRGPEDSGSSDCLQITGLRKHFGAVRANDGVDACFRFNEIHALLGENGAGKSTLIKIVGGVYDRDGGDVRLAGRPLAIDSPGDARRHGIAIVHQHSALVGALTVLENAALYFGGLGRIDKSLVRGIRETSDRLEFDLDPQARVSDLSVGQRQRAEIVRALMAKSRVIMLDEPTAVLGPSERSDLFRLLAGLSDSGAAVVLVTHRLEEAIHHCDRVTVLRGGKTVGTINDAQAASEREIIQMMVGKLRFEGGKDGNAPGATLLAVRGVSGAPAHGMRLEVPELTIRAGEVLGIAGVEGNGQREIAQLLTGSWTPPEGAVELHRKPLEQYSARERLRRIGDIPDDETYALSNELSVWENLAVDKMIHSDRPTPRARARFRREAAALVDEFFIRTPSVDTPVGRLSGGNRRRVQLARELSKTPELLVATYATKGLDVRSIEQVKQWCRNLARKGSGVVYIGSDLDELIGVADRIAVLARGRITGVLAAREATSDRLGELMLRDRLTMVESG